MPPRAWGGVRWWPSLGTSLILPAELPLRAPRSTTFDRSTVAALIAALAATCAHCDESLELRPRYNVIDESDKPERAEGFTVRAIAGFRTAPYRGLRLTLEAIHTDHFSKE